MPLKPSWGNSKHAGRDTYRMGFVDIAITVAVTTVSFLTGFCVRGLFAEEAAGEWPVIDRPSGHYEPPRRNERL